MSINVFLQDHIPQITATIGLVTYAALRNKLTADGIAAGVVVAVVHMLHPWSAFFWLLIAFFLFGTVVTRIGHDAKAHLTQSSTGSSGGEGARTSAQVFANSGFACALILSHLYLLNSTPFISSHMALQPGPYFPSLQRVLPIGIVSQYAAVAADTFSSELGILAKSQPVMITAPWKRVSRGTNGAVTVDGLLYGLLGSFLLTIVAISTFRFTAPGLNMSVESMLVTTIAGLLGSIIDSLLGALIQVTVTDRGTGKVIEGFGGQTVTVTAGDGRLKYGRDVLTNNGVNFCMAALTSILAMCACSLLGAPSYHTKMDL